MITLTLEQIQQKLIEINQKGFIGISEADYRRDDGITGQLLEKEFGLRENNLSVPDLGVYELKGFRKGSGNLTLFHKTPNRGLTPIQMFDRFGYVKASNRNPEVLKKKLFTTITGKKFNRLGLKLVSAETNTIEVYHHDEFISGWNLTQALNKPEKVIIVFAETTGKVNTLEERFHFKEAYRCEGFKDLTELVNDGVIFLDLCIDQVVGDTKVPHDRGPHIRIRKSKLSEAYRIYEKIL